MRSSSKENANRPSYGEFFHNRVKGEAVLVERFKTFLEELRKDKEIITWNENDAGIGIFGNIPNDKLEKFLLRVQRQQWGVKGYHDVDGFYKE